VYVKRLLASIADQTYRDFDIIITDNSPDNSIEMTAAQYHDQLPISYYRNDPPTGMAANFNEGLNKATGTWIKPMHDDDWFSTPHAMAQFAEAARGATSKFVFSACTNVYAPSGKQAPEILTAAGRKMLEDNHLCLFHKNLIGHPSVMMHINDSSLRYDTRFKWVVDIDFYLRFMDRYPGFDYIPQCLVNIGKDENQMSGQYYKNASVEVPEYLDLLAKYAPALAWTDRHVFHRLWDLARSFRLKSNADIEQCGYHGVVPGAMDKIIAYQQYIPRIILKQTPWSARLMKRCFHTIKQQ
jgi:glycosyltransferase involved in cell wall biosynthesis